MCSLISPLTEFVGKIISGLYNRYENHDDIMSRFETTLKPKLHEGETFTDLNYRVDIANTLYEGVKVHPVGDEHTSSTTLLDFWCSMGPFDDKSRHDTLTLT